MPSVESVVAATRAVIRRSMSTSCSGGEGGGGGGGGGGHCVSKPASLAATAAGVRYSRSVGVRAPVNIVGENKKKIANQLF